MTEDGLSQEQPRPQRQDSFIRVPIFVTTQQREEISLTCTSQGLDMDWAASLAQGAPQQHKLCGQDGHHRCSQKDVV